MACQTKVARKGRKLGDQRQMPRQLFIDRKKKSEGGDTQYGADFGVLAPPLGPERQQ
jgi:hypothetical protein